MFDILDCDGSVGGASPRWRESLVLGEIALVSTGVESEEGKGCADGPVRLAREIPNEPLVVLEAFAGARTSIVPSSSRRQRPRQ